MPTKKSEFDKFTSALDSILSVPKAELDRREAEYRKRANANPRKRGPKPKVKSGSSRDPAAD